MASLTPRASVFWSDSVMADRHYYPDDLDVEQQQRLMGSSVDGDDDGGMDDSRTPLDKTIDRIGMGSYQWALLSLCGFGWMADNMWIQAIAIILPRVQQHYSVSDNVIGSLSSSMFAGMMIGAVGWGTCSDLLGRSTAFNATLFFTALFGFFASWANSFVTLCIALFLLGSAVGGSMPTDGTLLLEHMPKEKQYLVTALSVFFSFGSVLSAFVALIILPGNSCPNAVSGCDVETQNTGWKYLLMTLASITLSMFLARIVFFRLHESPRYLVHAGRPHEAVKSLQMISKFNGSDLEIELDDVADHHLSTSSDPTHPSSSSSPSSQTQQPKSPPATATVTATPLDIQRDRRIDETKKPGDSGDEEDKDKLLQQSTLPDAPPRPRYSRHSTAASNSSRMSRASLTGSRRSSVYEYERKCRVLPKFVRRPLAVWWDRISMVLEPEWFRTTILVWAVWFSMSLAFTMFNVYLPKLLELAGESNVEVGAKEAKTLEENLWDVMIFTIGGTPGAILGAWLIESSLGRRWSLAASTFITAAFCVLFAMVDSTWAVRLSTVGISLSATAMWAVLYGWTPEIFGTKVRGSACGIASALSRIGGMIAPLLGGTLLMINRAVPVYTSVVVFAIAGFCVLLLKEDEGDKSTRGKGRVIVH
ncbi:hypothetical protein AN958_07202 [Leucoagaricus sp. SymC.cos]|nr:hypothetical protein AN958_07202 [Leucoagaricus sp. SymC.cos]